MEEKHFLEWIKLKETIHNKNHIRTIHEGEIWWCAIGENVGVEINGKNQVFSRPVLILKKLSKYGFLGIPLTSKMHEGSWYAHFTFQNKEENAALAQIRIMSVSRLYDKMGCASNHDYDYIMSRFIDFLLTKNVPQVR